MSAPAVTAQQERSQPGGCFHIAASRRGSASSYAIWATGRDGGVGRLVLDRLTLAEAERITARLVDDLADGLPWARRLVRHREGGKWGSGGEGPPPAAGGRASSATAPEGQS